MYSSFLFCIGILAQADQRALNNREKIVQIYRCVVWLRTRLSSLEYTFFGFKENHCADIKLPIVPICKSYKNVWAVKNLVYYPIQH